MKRIWPPTIRPAGGATSRMMLSAETDLPQPDSPTSATVSPSADVPRHAVDRAHHAAARLKVSLKIANLQQGRHSARECSTRRRGPERASPAGSVYQMQRPESRWDDARSTSAAYSRQTASAMQGQRCRAAHCTPSRPRRKRRSGSPSRRSSAPASAAGSDSRHQQAGDPVAHGRLQPAHAGGDDGNPARHRLQRDHAERLVVRGQHGGVGGHVPGPQPLLGLGADERDGAAEIEPGQARAQRALVPVERLVGVAADDATGARGVPAARSRAIASSSVSSPLIGARRPT